MIRKYEQEGTWTTDSAKSCNMMSEILYKNGYIHKVKMGFDKTGELLFTITVAGEESDKELLRLLRGK